MSLPRIVQLAATISESVGKLNDTLSSKGLPTPSFEEDAPASLPDETSDVQDAILDAAAELFDLVLEPVALIKYHGAHNNCTCLQAIARFGIANMVPAGGQTSFADIAEKTGLSEDMTRRLLRFAITMRIFREPVPGMVAHTKASKMLTNPAMNGWLNIGTGEMWPAAARMIDALQKWPEGSEPNETGFQLANNITDSIYLVLGNDPIRGAQFGNAMKLEATSPTRDPKHLIDNYDWAGLGPAQLVDVGGAQGHISIELAKRFGNISAIVQDMGEVMANAEAGVPPELQGRIRFMAHDMFLPQPIVGADIYLLRWILHNWSDKYCLLILRALVPALKPGAKLILMEACMPDPGEVALWREKDHRASDMTMASAFNAKERTKKEWETLITEADPRFLMEGIAEPKESALAIIKVVWNSEG